MLNDLIRRLYLVVTRSVTARLTVMASDGTVSTNDAVVNVMVKRYTGPTIIGGAGNADGTLGAFQQQPQSQLQQPQQPFQQQPILPPHQQQVSQQLPGMGQQLPLSPNLQQQPPSHITP
jgi:hypothetical protein